MAIGPFDSFVFPGVYTRTLTEAPRATAAGGLRVPAFIGIAADTVPVTNYEMIRGSSSMADNPIIKENVSNQITGSNRNVFVTMTPVVNGDGTGTVTNDPTKVTVYVNGNPVPVASLDGVTGEIYLVNIPPMDAEVLVSYFFKVLDTLHTDEDLSDQVDGVATTFQVHYYPIVTGDNSGLTSTDVTTIVVKVNGGTVTPSSLNGDAGQFTLSSAPLLGDILTITYYSNEEQNTSDILPSPYVASMISVGYSPGQTDFIEDVDYVLDSTSFTSSTFSTLQWGNSYKLVAGTTTVGFTPFDTAQVTSRTMYDNFNSRREASGTTDGTNKTFVVEVAPVTGSGRAKTTEDPSHLTAYDGTSTFNAVVNDILTVTPGTRTITLATAPDASTSVYASQYAGLLTTDTWTIACTVAGVDGVGQYTVTGASSGVAMDVRFIDATVADGTALFNSEGITYPTGHTMGGGGNENHKDVQVTPGACVEETVTLQFINATSYTVTSTETNGSGSGGDNTGFLNQTYIDPMTGFRASIMAPTAFDYTANDKIHYQVTPDIVTSSILETRAVPGMRLLVENTTGINVGDTAVLNTYSLIAAREPAVGDFYYVSFNETKQFDANGIGTAKLYTNENDVLTDTGALTIDNKIGLAANFAFLNGAAAVVLLQIEKTTGGTDAPSSRYIAGIDYFNEPMEGGLRPSLIQPIIPVAPSVSGDPGNTVMQYAKSSDSIQSGIRYGNEHRTYFGFQTNTTPTAAQSYARGMNNERMVAVYPDGAVMVITDALGNQTEYLVDGSFLASAIAGRDVSPAFDVAEPMTSKPVVGFTRLYRRMDSVTSAQTSNAGITLIEEVAGGMQIKFALTTNTESVLTRTPSIVRVKDFVQRGARAILTPYIGTKMLIQRTTEIQGTLDSYLASLQQAQIITGFQPTVAKVDAADPSIINVTSFYSPVPELLWIVVTFNLRSAV